VQIDMNVNIQLLKWHKLKIPLSAIGKGVSLEECTRKLVGSNPIFQQLIFFYFVLVLTLQFS
jgi:hypothetical protein